MEAQVLSFRNHKPLEMKNHSKSTNLSILNNTSLAALGHSLTAWKTALTAKIKMAVRVL